MPKSWTYAAGHLLGLGLRGLINAAYIEYEQVVDPGDAVAIPDPIDPGEGIDYYAALVDQPTRDYVRIPLVFPPSLSQSDALAAVLAADQGDVLSWPIFAAAGGTGVHGRDFTAAAQAKICGYALVHAPDWDDLAQDLVFARAYHEAADQVLIPASGQIHVVFPVRLPAPTP